ncbi:MAG: AsmA-like C-terminal region-containing protein [Candidatus Omnitrophica bacterium]|nr:AsmA-like C-terminal region-containing protein [Candidatus Omnitrophota bacterium]MBU1923173.1 AsmA-like C-terminal region-containing protein [Candidatus Omnitrophota bacterium]
MIKKIIISVLLVLLITVVAAFLYLNNVYIPKNLKPLVISTLEKALDKKVTIDQASYFPIRGVLFSKIKIINKDASPFLDINKIDLSLKSLPKFKGKDISAQTKLVVQGISFMQEKLKVEGNAAVDLNVEGMSGNKPLFKAILTIDNFRVSGIPPLADITKLSGEVICTHNSLSTNKLGALINKEKIDISLEGTYSENDLNLTKIDLVYAKTHIQSSAEVRNFKEPEFKLNAAGLLNLEDIEKMLIGITLPKLTGDCKLQAQASGKISDLNSLFADVKVGMSEGSVDKIRFSNVDASLTLEQGTAYFEPVKCTFYEGKISGSGNAKVFQKELPVTAVLDAQGVNLAPLVKDLAGLDIGSGDLNANAEISGPVTDLNALSGNGALKLTDAKIQMPSKLGGFVKIFQLDQLSQMLISEASATFTIAEGKIDTQDFKMIADMAEFAATGYATFGQYIDFTVEIDLAPELKDRAGIAGAIIRKVRARGQLPDKIKTDILMQDAIKEVVKEAIKEKGAEILKEVFGQEQQQAQPEGNIIQDQLKKGLKGLFKR